MSERKWHPCAAKIIDDIHIHIHTDHVQGLLYALLLLGMELEPLSRPGHNSRAFYALLAAAEAECAAIARTANMMVKCDREAKA